jgi:hypothetical protein
MKGSIHGIWFTTQKDRTLHPMIGPFFSAWARQTTLFNVVLWTNTNEVQPELIDDLEKRKVVVKDYSECKESRFYPYFLFFFAKGLQGDLTAFAMASDIFRMAILELTPAEDCFIYADPNDTVFFNLNRDLQDLREKLEDTVLGFSFYAEEEMDESGPYFHIRNDVLIALKTVNPDFFESYFQKYQKHLEESYRFYRCRPRTETQALELANAITVPLNNDFFEITRNRTKGEKHRVSACFANGQYSDFCTNVHSKRFLSYERSYTNGSTWLPSEDLPAKNLPSEEMVWMSSDEMVSIAMEHIEEKEKNKNGTTLLASAVLPSPINVSMFFNQKKTADAVDTCSPSPVDLCLIS